MKVLYLCIAFALIMCTSLEASELEVVKGNGVFSNNMYNILAREEGNVFFSPLSAHAALSMALQGAKGNTAKAFTDTLKVSASDAAEGYNQIMGRLNAVENVTLEIANKIYVKEGLNLQTGYKDVVTKKFYSDIESVNFVENVKAADTINKWVSDKTKGKITELIKARDLDELTRLVLLNAIYFKGKWSHPFKTELTRVESFYLNDKDSVNVPMMHLKENFRFKEDSKLNAKILELPYTNSDLSMLIILPNERNGIKELEKKLIDVDLNNVLNDMFFVDVVVSLPKFKIEKTIELNNVLEEMGLGIMFDMMKADFRGIIDNKEQLSVSKVIQKSFVEVNEEGAEAAAVTGIVGVGSSLMAPKPVTVFEANHPFIFTIIRKGDNGQGTNLFVGKISKF